MHKYKCSICGYVNDEATGIPEKGIAPGTKWEDLPEDWVCPLCGAPKSVFSPIEEEIPVPMHMNVEPTNDHKELSADKLSAGELSAICSSLAKGCEKQRLNTEMEAWVKIAEYYKAKIAAETGKTLEDAAELLGGDLAKRIPTANAVANADKDRGALRSLVWSEKVSTMQKALLERFAKEGDAMLANTKIWVCDICGFIYIGDAPPEICPVCKVPSYRIQQVERR
jgi:rubredoxin